MAAKELKVGSLAIPKESRMNPDTSRGLYVNAGVRAQARSIQLLKDKKSEEDKLKRIEITKKNADILRKREEAYTKLTIDMNRSVSPIEDVLSTMTTESLKLAYQHLGGVISKLPNGRKETYISVICNMPEIAAIERWTEIKAHDASVDKDDAFSNEITQEAMI